MTDIDKEGRHSDVAWIAQSLRQFDRLREADPPLTCAEIAHRMAWTKKQTRWLLTKFKDRRA